MAIPAMNTMHKLTSEQVQSHQSRDNYSNILSSMRFLENLNLRDSASCPVISKMPQADIICSKMCVNVKFVSLFLFQI